MIHEADAGTPFAVLETALDSYIPRNERFAIGESAYGQQSAPILSDVLQASEIRSIRSFAVGGNLENGGDPLVI